MLKESGVTAIGGIQGDYEYIEFDRGALHKSAIRLIQTIWSLNPGKLTLGKNGPLGMPPEILEAALTAQPHEPMLRVMLAKQHSSSGRCDAAVRELQGVLADNPNLVQARLELVKGLQSLGRAAEARREIDTLLKGSPFNSEAHHQKAHVLENGGDLDGAAESFRKAAECEPGKAHHYQCLGKLLFRSAKGDRGKLAEAKEALTQAISLGNEKIANDCRGFLQAIERSNRKASNGSNRLRRKKRK